MPDLEVHYQNVVYILTKLLNFIVQTERKTSNGRIDMTIQTTAYTYIIEFKLNASSDVALSQIHDRGYISPFEANGKQLILIRVNFSSKTRAIDSWKIERL